MPEQTSTYTFADLSGAAATSQDVNPYNALIHACANDAVQLSLHCHFALFIITRTSSKKREHDANIIWSQQTLTAAYETHRTTRAAQQRALLLSPSFPGPTIDTILSRLTSHDPDFHDTRYCLVFWARPTERVKKLAYELQGRVRDVLPSLWPMPPANLHMTALEITHSRTPSDIASLVARLHPLMQTATDMPFSLAQAGKAVRLCKPQLTYDGAAVALSWLPEADGYTYHHLRRDLWDLCSETSEGHRDRQGLGVPIGSRYVVPSAHLTLLRFITAEEVVCEGRVKDGVMERFVAAIEGANEWLRTEVWGSQDGRWEVGKENGLDCRHGALWYGGGETVMLGRGIGE